MHNLNPFIRLYRPFRSCLLTLSAAAMLTGSALAAEIIVGPNGSASPLPAQPPVSAPVSESFENPSEGNLSQISSGNDLFAGTTSQNLILIDADNGDVLSSVKATERIYPASMTKMMTAITAIEQLSSMDTQIMVPNDLYERIDIYEASIAGFEAGETTSAYDLLCGVLLPSGAECSLALADYLAGSESAFVEQMNSKAAQLGMANTHFVNPTGLHDDNHYSTAADMATLLRYCLQNQTFRSIITQVTHTMNPTSRHPQGFEVMNTLYKMGAVTTFPGGQILGGKTGYTRQAGQCLASFTQIGVKTYILVTAGAPGTPDGEQLHIQDAVTVYTNLAHSLV
ncbi:MAG: serine hydrolase [Lachnospiraceae bacterium]|nr:serine hydrolase [Lachnospiraceae bacterium]